MNANIPAFYDHCGPDSTGRSLTELEPGQGALIERFIDGECNDAEKCELAAFLLSNPQWICWVARRVNKNFETSHRHGRKGYFVRSAV